MSEWMVEWMDKWVFPPLPGYAGPRAQDFQAKKERKPRCVMCAAVEGWIIGGSGSGIRRGL